MSIADRIRDLRKTKGISQEQLADAIGVSRQAVSKWESEQNIPEIDKIIKLGEYFEVTTDYILNGIEKVESKKNNWNRILTVFATCFNFIGLVILFFDAYNSWNWKPFAMSNTMIITKIVVVVCMVIGTALFYVSNEKLEYKQIRMFLMINIFAYASLIPMITYLLDKGYIIGEIAEIIVIFVVEVILIKKKK